MNIQDRQLLDALNRRHLNLEIAVAGLKADLREFTARLETPEFVPPLQPTVPEPIQVSVAAFVAPTPAQPPPIPPEYAIPAETSVTASLPPIPQSVARVEPEGPGFEIQFGRWLARIGVVFALLTLIFFSVLAYDKFHQYIGPWSKLGVLALVSSALFAAGLWLERKSSDLVVYGRTVAGGGLACLYYTLYGATYVRQLEVIHTPLVGGLLLLVWSAGVLVLAERRKSELLSIFAISLAYFSSAITPVGGFTMVADLLLAATAVVFLVRNSWTGLSYLCLIGTYLGFIRQIVPGEPDMPFNFNFVQHLAFWPSATYLTGAWLIFTAGIFLAKAPDFNGGKRMAFLCLNNGAWAGLLVVASRLSGYGHVGGMLCLVGGLLIGAWFLALRTRADEHDVAEAYLMQGLAFATGGVVIAYTGVTRGLIVTVESVFLAAAGAFSRNRILRAGAGIAALLGAGFLANEIAWDNAHPWILTGGGAAAMFVNAWFARFDYWREPFEAARARFVPASACFVLLGIGLLLVGIGLRADQAWIAPSLALASLVLAASIYAIPLFELPPLSQLLLVSAQFVSFGYPLIVTYGPLPNDSVIVPQSLWSQSIVAVATMLLVTWWPRQTRVVKGVWLAPLMGVYALALAAFAFDAVHPHVSEQNWMMSAAALSLVFVAFGAWNRSWSFIASGQILLALSVITFFHPNDPTVFPWTWWAAAVPIAVVFLTGWIAHQVLAYAFNGSAIMRENLRVLALIYQTIAIGLLVRWIFGIVPTDEITLAVFALATAFIAGGLRGSSSYFVRAGLVLDVVGIGNYLSASEFFDAHAFTWLDATAFALFLTQPALLRHWGREVISEAESWLAVLASSGAAWLFVSNSISSAGSHNLTLGWALFALALTILGFAASERRQRWCGLGILAAAFVRVAVHDFWGFSDAGKVLTFFALTVVCLGLSFLYYKFADKWKEWL
jgi:hypothetical protein